MIIHKLEKEEHNDFLSQERIDPITGDILQEGDSIVICANCKSAFLSDSWLYMDSKHCNQTHTLREIPKQEAVKIDRESRNERLDKLAFFQFRTVRESEISGVYTGFFALIGGVITYATYILNTNFGFFGILAVLLGIFIGKNMYKQKTLLLNSGQFIINQDKKNQAVVDSKNVSSIHVKKAKFISRLANSALFKKGEEFYDLIITTKNGKTHKVFISENELQRIEQQTNILKKYNIFDTNQLSVRNTPLITPQNDRIDLS